MDACVVEIEDKPELIEYKRITDTLKDVNRSDNYTLVNDRLFGEAEKNTNSWLYNKIHSSAPILASNYLVRNLNIKSTVVHFVKK